MELKARTAQSIAQEEEMLEIGAPDGIEPELVYLKSEAEKESPLSGAWFLLTPLDL